MIKISIYLSKIFKLLIILFKGIREIFYPNVCIRCDSLSTDMICNECSKLKLFCNTKKICYRCGINGEFRNNICKQCLDEKRYYKKCRTIVRYNSGVVDLIHMFKYNQRLDCADYIVKDIVNNFPYNKIDFNFITCVPNHYLSYIKKGFHHTEYLALQLEKELKIPFKYFVKRVGFVRSQTHVSSSLRSKNVENSFKLTESTDLSGQNILLIEDVITTGSTIKEMCKVLSNTNANIYVLAYADARHLKEI